MVSLLRPTEDFRVISSWVQILYDVQKNGFYNVTVQGVV